MPNSKSFQPGPTQTVSVVDGFCGDTTIVERLKEMGLHQGLRLRYIGQAPLSGPYLFRLGATVIALREEEAQCLMLQRI